MKITKRPKDLNELMDLIKQAAAEGAEVEIIDSVTGEKGVDGLLRALSGSKGHEGCGDPTCEACATQPSEDAPRLFNADTVSLLLDVVESHQKPIAFKPGDFVRYRKDVQYVRRGRDLHVILSMIEPPFEAPRKNDDELGGPIAYRTYNCVVGAVTRKGVARHVVDSRELEYFPKDELSKVLADIKKS